MKTPTPRAGIAERQRLRARRELATVDRHPAHDSVTNLFDTLDFHGACHACFDETRASQDIHVVKRTEQPTEVRSST